MSLKRGFNSNINNQLTFCSSMISADLGKVNNQLNCQLAFKT